MLFQNDGQRPKKSWAMFSKTTGNVFQNYGQCFGKLWAMFCKPISHAFFQAMQDLYLIGKGVVETCLEPETGLRNVA